MNKFYKIPKAIQWLLAVSMLLLFLGIFIGWIELSQSNPLWYLSIFLIVPLMQFLSTPFFTLVGLYKYLSPMLLVFGANQKKYDIHNGTSFDYLFVMNKVTSGSRWRSKMLGYYIEGLLEIIKKIEVGELSGDIEIRGSSYFFSERTAKRMGFELEKTGFFEKFNILLNIVDITWMYSKAMGEFSFPAIFKMNTAKISGNRLVSKKKQLQDLYDYMNGKLSFQN